MPKTIKGGPFDHFENPVCCKIEKKLKRGDIGNIKKCRGPIGAIKHLSKKVPEC